MKQKNQLERGKRMMKLRIWRMQRRHPAIGKLAIEIYRKVIFWGYLAKSLLALLALLILSASKTAESPQRLPR
jgi:hypothetical protein